VESGDAGLAKAWQALWSGAKALTVAPRSRIRVIVDLEDYVCAFPRLVTRGGKGSQVRIQWAESLFLTTGGWEKGKGNRDEVEGKYFQGVGDSFFPSGGTSEFDTLWWQAGRYLEILV